MVIADIVSSIYRRTKTNSVSFPAADMLIAINEAYDEVVSLCIDTDGRWQFDDSNYTDLPIGTTALVASQSDYAFSTSHLEVTRVEFKDASGIWRWLQPIDQDDLRGVALGQFLNVPGVPYKYDKLANSLFLYPAPNFSQAASLKVYFKRGPAAFTSGEVSTGTKTPGFSSIYHELIPLMVSYDYAVNNGLPNANFMLAKIQKLQERLMGRYNDRSKDEQRFIRGVSRARR